MEHMGSPVEDDGHGFEADVEGGSEEDARGRLEDDVDS